MQVAVGDAGVVSGVIDVGQRHFLQPVEPGDLGHHRLQPGRLEVVRLASTTSLAAAAPAAGFRLEAPYPAPFADRVWLGAELPAPADVVVRVYDLLGRRVRTLYDGEAAAGRQVWVWDGRGDDGSLLPAGRYFVEVRAGAAVARRSVVRVR